MRTVKVQDITAHIKEMCIEANHFLTEDMKCALNRAAQTEKTVLGQQILGQLQENLKIAGEDMIPICQDTGMAVVFAEIGQEVHLEGGSLEEAIHEAYRLSDGVVFEKAYRRSDIGQRALQALR